MKLQNAPFSKNDAVCLIGRPNFLFIGVQVESGKGVTVRVETVEALSISRIKGLKSFSIPSSRKMYKEAFGRKQKE